MSPHTDFAPPGRLRTRGAVLVVPGRGETRDAYTRFGTRLAADAYQVRVVDAPRIDPADVPGSLTRFAGLLRAAAADLTDHPLVVVGADSGAAAVAALGGAGADALVLAGLPGQAAGVTGGWPAELGVRTSCPVHRGVLDAQPEDTRGALRTALPDELLAAAHSAVTDVPQLVLVGDADPLADRETLARTVKSQRHGRLSVVHGAHHDVLNDRQHRSVAAEVVAFLETLGNELVPVITVESSAW